MVALRSLFCLLFLLPIGLSAQHYGAYVDFQQHFWVFEKGKFKKIESQPIQEFKVARNFVAYISKMGQLKVYRDGKAEVLTENTPDFYHVTDNLMVFSMGNTKYVYEGTRWKRLGAWMGSQYTYGDSLVSVFDQFNNFAIYYEKEVDPVDAFQVHGVQNGKNILVWLDNMEQMVIHYHGQSELLEQLTPLEYKPGLNLVAYVDNYRQFQVWHAGSRILLETFPPNSYQVGDNLVGFVNRGGEFRVFDNGLILDLDENPPLEYFVKDRLLVWIDAGNTFKAYYDGLIFDLESYVPKHWEMDNEVLAYRTYTGHVKALYKGEVVQVTNRVATDFNVHLDVVTSEIGLQKPQFYWNGKFY